jgi:hypothetical protein
MFKVNIYSAPGEQFINRELFNDGAHAESWAIEDKLKTGLHYEIVNLSLDPEWVEKDIQEKRRKEYPGELEVIEALREAVAENRPEKLQEIQAKIEAIKIKYPKPPKGS